MRGRKREAASRTSQQGGKGSKKGRKHRSRVKAGAGDRGSGLSSQTVSGQTDGKHWRLGGQGEPGPGVESGGRRQGRDQS